VLTGLLVPDDGNPTNLPLLQVGGITRTWKNLLLIAVGLNFNTCTQRN